MMDFLLRSFIIAVAFAAAASGFPDAAASPPGKIESGTLWKDVAGDTINAHGGCVIFAGDRYYWYGEHRCGSGPNIQEGVTVYSSPDLTEWTYEGLAFRTEQSAGSDVERGCIVERPKVVFNKSTGKYVMWFHLELKGQGYGAARCAVAVADTPTGPFRFVRSGRVNPGIMPMNLCADTLSHADPEKMEWWTPEWRREVARGMFVTRDLPGGQMSRDMTIFVDDDGKAYHIYSSEENLTLHIAELSDDYLSHTGRYIRIFPGGHNEAPAIFRHDGRYWMITSGCTGWEPNEARLMTAEDLFGEWRQLPNPCVGENASKTFLAQSNYVMRLPGSRDAFIAMFDRWRPKSLKNSRHVWLPVSFGDDGVPRVTWNPSWSLDEVPK